MNFAFFCLDKYFSQYSVLKNYYFYLFFLRHIFFPVLNCLSEKKKKYVMLLNSLLLYSMEQ